MPALQQEEFLREMVALPPEERQEFIQNFMAIAQDGEDDLDDASINDDDFF